MARGRSSLSQQPQFRIQWRDVVEVAPALVTGMSEEEAAKAHEAARPLLVYLYDASEDGQQLAIEEDAAFQVEKVAVGARFFECVRIDTESAASDRVLKEYVKKAPCLVFVRPNFETADLQRAKFNGNKVFGAMCATMKKDYKNCVQTVFKKQRDIERDRASLQRDKDKLARIDEQLADEKSAAKRARLDKERTELQEKLSVAEQKLLDLENSLYALEPKEAS